MRQCNVVKPPEMSIPPISAEAKRRRERRERCEALLMETMERIHSEAMRETDEMLVRLAETECRIAGTIMTNACTGELRPVII